MISNYLLVFSNLALIAVTQDISSFRNQQAVPGAPGCNLDPASKNVFIDSGESFKRIGLCIAKSCDEFAGSDAAKRKMCGDANQKAHGQAGAKGVTFPPTGKFKGPNGAAGGGGPRMGGAPPAAGTPPGGMGGAPPAAGMPSGDVSKFRNQQAVPGAPGCNLDPASKNVFIDSGESFKRIGLCIAKSCGEFAGSDAAKRKMCGDANQKAHGQAGAKGVTFPPTGKFKGPGGAGMGGPPKA